MVKKDPKPYGFENLNKELNEVYDYLKNEKYKESEIRKIFRPFIKGTEKSNRFVKLCSAVLFTFISLYLLSYNDRVSWNLSAIGRIMLIKALPYWDWTYLTNKRCLIEKTPLSSSESTFNCGMCEYLHNVPYLNSNIPDEDLDEKFIKVQKPVIIREGLKETWNLSPTFIDNIYNDDDIYDSNPCLASSSFTTDGATVGKLLKRAKNLDQFYLHFQNCDFEPMRIFRKYSYRPDFLPNYLSPVSYNWLLWNKNYNTTKYKTIDLIEKITLIVQVHGSTELKLLPRKNCQHYCDILNTTLHQGESLLLTTMWDLEYKPYGTDENIAVILEIRGG